RPRGLTLSCSAAGAGNLRTSLRRYSRGPSAMIFCSDLLSERLDLRLLVVLLILSGSLARDAFHGIPRALRRRQQEVRDARRCALGEFHLALPSVDECRRALRGRPHDSERKVETHTKHALRFQHLVFLRHGDPPSEL